MNITTHNYSGKFTIPDGGLKMPFVLESRLNCLPAYKHSAMSSRLLDPLREFLNDGNYMMTQRAIPSTQQQQASNVIPGMQMYEDQLSVPEGSFLVMIGGVGTATGGFRVRLYDVGGQVYLSDNFVRDNNTMGAINPLGTTGQPFISNNAGTFGQGKNFGLFILPSPVSITSPGQLNIQIVNLDTGTNTVEMGFFFAVPVHTLSKVKPTDQLASPNPARF